MTQQQNLKHQTRRNNIISNTSLKVGLSTMLLLYIALTSQAAQANSAPVTGAKVSATVKYLPFADTPREEENVQCKTVGENQLCWYQYAQAAELTCDSNDNWRWINGGEASKLYGEHCAS